MPVTRWGWGTVMATLTHTETVQCIQVYCAKVYVGYDVIEFINHAGDTFRTMPSEHWSVGVTAP